MPAKPKKEKTQHGKIPVAVFSKSGEASIAIANETVGSIRKKQEKNGNCVLGLATGPSPKHLYAELIRLHEEGGLSFKNVVTFNLDEYCPMKPGAT